MEHILASGNSIFPASPLCLNSWAQSGFDRYFQSFLQILDDSPPVCKSTADVLTCILVNIHVPVLSDGIMSASFDLPIDLVAEVRGSSVMHLARGGILMFSFKERTTHGTQIKPTLAL